MPAPTSFPSHLKLDTETWSPGVTPGPRPWDGDPNLICQVTKGTLRQDTYLLLQPLLKQSQKIQVMFYCISHPATGTGHGVRSRGTPRSASSQVEPGLRAHRLYLHHTGSGRDAHALSRPTTAVLNWTISRSTEKTAEPKQAACCKQTRGTVTSRTEDTAVPAGTSLQRGGDDEGEKLVLVCQQEALFGLGNMD